MRSHWWHEPFFGMRPGLLRALVFVSAMAAALPFLCVFGVLRHGIDCLQSSILQTPGLFREFWHEARYGW